MTHSKSKPVFSFGVDTAKDHFILDYRFDGLSMHAEGPFKTLVPQLRKMAAPLVAVMSSGFGGGILPYEPAVKRKTPGKKTARKTKKTRKVSTSKPFDYRH